MLPLVREERTLIVARSMYDFVRANISMQTWFSTASRAN